MPGGGEEARYKCAAVFLLVQLGVQTQAWQQQGVREEAGRTFQLLANVLVVC